MKHLFTILFLMASAIAHAQISNATYTDCDNITKTIYGTLAQNKVLVIASKGLDCSICMGQAPNLQTFAAAQQSRIEVWGAMNYKYSATVPNCTQTNNWKLSYSWNNIFMFIDGSDEWEGQGYPTYYVINPFDTSIAYEGVIWNDASAKALELADSIGLVTGIKNFNATAPWSAHLAADRIVIRAANALPNENINVMLTDVSGKIIVNTKENFHSSLSIPLSEKLNAGIYILSLKNAQGVLLVKKFSLIN